MQSAGSHRRVSVHMVNSPIPFGTCVVRVGVGGPGGSPCADYPRTVGAASAGSFAGIEALFAPGGARPLWPLWPQGPCPSPLRRRWCRAEGTVRRSSPCSARSLVPPRCGISGSPRVRRVVSRRWWACPQSAHHDRFRTVSFPFCWVFHERGTCGPCTAAVVVNSAELVKRRAQTAETL